MKRIFLCILLFTFFFFPSFVFAKDIIEYSDTPSATDTPSIVSDAKEEKLTYELAYPGILPDHPLYPLKAFRDRVIGMLISDPYKKAEFNLLQADKRLHGGLYLVRKNNTGLAVTTISKGINYFELAIDRIRAAKDLGVDIKGFLDKLKASANKHEEILAGIRKDADLSYKDSISSEQKRIDMLKKSIQEIKKTVK